MGCVSIAHICASSLELSKDDLLLQDLELMLSLAITFLGFMLMLSILCLVFQLLDIQLILEAPAFTFCSKTL
jgi:uncharacterized membrane protein YqjE